MRACSLALSAGGIVLGVLLWLGLRRAIPESDAYAAASGRLAAAAGALLPAAAVLAAMILSQMGLRFALGRFDPTDGADGRRLAVNQRVITNTVEQMACLIPSLLALAAVAEPAWMPMVLAAALTFACARVAFWAGYHAGPLWRAPGMAASGTANIGLLAAALWAWLG
ncbi:MAG: MAPEG family protein [Proteobacteria bacterium]|nr:MAPEG family protein [Pseudomonadota bacterium]